MTAEDDLPVAAGGGGSGAGPVDLCPRDGAGVEVERMRVCRRAGRRWFYGSMAAARAV
ncbi:MAG: hypothetical protein IPP47_31760 [Bryobacterales bacterium]|nr:hypothetical protein [Bryobacterales bacterium]